VEEPTEGCGIGSRCRQGFVARHNRCHARKKKKDTPHVFLHARILSCCIPPLQGGFMHSKQLLHISCNKWLHCGDDFSSSHRRSNTRASSSTARGRVPPSAVQPGGSRARALGAWSRGDTRCCAPLPPPLCHGRHDSCAAPSTFVKGMMGWSGQCARTSNKRCTQTLHQHVSICSVQG